MTPEVSAQARALRTPELSVEWGRERREQGHTRKRQWTPREDRLLGKICDTDLARLVGCNVRMVAARRIELGIARCPDARGGSHVLHLPRYSSAKLQTRRLELGLFQTDVSARCGWRPTIYQRLETGRTDRITRKVLAVLAKALECDQKDLLADGETNEQRRP